MIPRLKKEYNDKIKKALMKKLKLENIVQVPKLEKIVINMGLGEAVDNIKVLDKAEEELKLITGQKPTLRRSKKAISNFKLKKGEPIGLSATLRRNRMYEFIDRLISIVLPRIKDFRGISKKSFDGRGNYTLGVDDQLIFPEIEYDKVDKARGMNITIVTTADTDKQAFELLSMLGMPFRN